MRLNWKLELDYVRVIKTEYKSEYIHSMGIDFSTGSIFGAGEIQTNITDYWRLGLITKFTDSGTYSSLQLGMYNCPDHYCYTYFRQMDIGRNKKIGICGNRANALFFARITLDFLIKDQTSFGETWNANGGVTVTGCRWVPGYEDTDSIAFVIIGYIQYDPNFTTFQGNNNLFYIKLDYKGE